MEEYKKTEEVKGKNFKSNLQGKDITIRYKKKQSEKWKKNLEKYETKLKRGEIKNEIN